MSNKLFIDLHESKSVDMSFGILCINKKTLKLSRGVESQNMPSDEIYIKSLENSILENGYNPSYPIVLNKELKTVDGFSRLSAANNIIESGQATQILIPFYTGTEEGGAYNSSTRGTSPTDIEYLFRVARSSGLFTGKSKRAAEQSIEASQMLDMSKLDCDFTKAFAAHNIQRHTSKIVREREAFVNGYTAVCEVCTKLGISPDEVKWAHWLAMFCRAGVSNATKAIAKSTVIENTGTTQLVRYKAFEACMVSVMDRGL